MFHACEIHRFPLKKTAVILNNMCVVLNQVDLKSLHLSILFFLSVSK